MRKNLIADSPEASRDTRILKTVARIMPEYELGEEGRFISSQELLGFAAPVQPPFRDGANGIADQHNLHA